MVVNARKSLEYNQTLIWSEMLFPWKRGSRSNHIPRVLWQKKITKKRIKQRQKIATAPHIIIQIGINTLERKYTHRIHRPYLNVVNQQKLSQVFLNKDGWYGYSKYGFIDLIIKHEKGVFLFAIWKRGWTKVDVKDNS